MQVSRVDCFGYCAILGMNESQAFRGGCRVSSKADLFYLIDQGEKYPEVISAS